MDLYTSLTRLKMALNNGHMPPMTPLTERAKRYLDPALTPGMGALEAHKTKGVRCPVRRCGKFFHNLASHLNWMHAGIGGRDAVVAALGLPRTVVLASQQFRENKAAWALKRHADGTMRNGADGSRELAKVNGDPAMLSRRGQTYVETQQSPMMKNLRDRCESQIASAVLALAQELGESPSWQAAESKYGTKWVREARAAYGSWNTLKAHVGLRIQKRQWTVDEIVESLENWYKAHGSLPSAAEALNPTRAPITPAPSTVLRVMHAQTWNAAMEGVAFILGVAYRPRRVGERRASTAHLREPAT